MLTDGGQTRNLTDCSETKGFLIRGQELQQGAVAAQIPDTLMGAEQSVCGVKGFLVDERRAFTAADGRVDTVDCAKVAALDIVDSPVHVHGETIETYHITAGNGRMVLGEEIVDVTAGSFIVIPPGVEHGLCSTDEQQPLRVVMTFTPGLAPIQHEEWRDEKIIYPAASQRIAAITGQ